MFGLKPEQAEAVITVLNKARTMELHSINQYMHQHYILDDLDYGELAKNIKLIAIDEMRHAEMFAERIMDLEGVPTHELDQKVTKGQKVEEIYPFNRGLEDNTIERYNEFLKICRDNNDSVTARLFERVLDEEQEHGNYFDDQDHHVSQLGVSYLAKVAASEGSTGGQDSFVKTSEGVDD